MGRKRVKPRPNMEEILNYIGKRYINVDKGKKRSANQELNRVLMHVTNAMKSVSPFFKAMFQTFVYAGSSYDGLKIGKPDEFDIDFKLDLPAILDVQVYNSDKDGFVHIWLKNWQRLKKDRVLYAKYRDLEHFIDDKYYLSHVKIKQWMESIVTKAIYKLNMLGKFGTLNVEHKKSGPAITLVITNTTNAMTVDLVPVFKIENKKWPKPPVRQNIYSKKGYLVVPKPPKATNRPLGACVERYWKLFFPEQEMEHMRNYNYLKPALRCLKKLRDTRVHNIPSCFIKNIFLLEINKKEKQFWKQSATDVFIEMLKTYRDYLQNHKIPYFWNENYDLIETMSNENIENITNFLNKMIIDIDKLKNKHPIIVAKYILPTEEYIQVCKDLKVIII